MENLRYLLAAIAALTLIMSVVSGVNPSYFAGLNAYADHEDEEEEDDDNSGSGSNDEEESEEEDDDEDNKDKGKSNKEDEDEFKKSLGNHSKVTLEIDDDAELSVEIEDGDLNDGQYDVVFACTSPQTDAEFAHALEVQDGEGEFEADLSLPMGTYSGCEVDVGGLSATFPSFTLTARGDEDDEEDEENEEEDQDEGDENDKHGDREKSKSKLKADDDGVEIEVEIKGLNMTDGSYDAVFACDQPAFNVTLDGAFEVEDGEGELEETLGLANNTYTGCDITVEGTVIASFDRFTVSEETEEEQEHEVEEKRKEKKEKIVTTVNGTTIHEKHRSKNAASPGEFEPGWNYTLEADGNATATSGNETGDAEVDINMAVWKSTRAIILLDVIDGTVKVGNQNYTVVLGYALYTINHDAFRVGALAIGDDGEIYKLKLRGSAADEAEFPMESGSLELTFEGISGPSNRLGDWELTLEGTVKAG